MALEISNPELIRVIYEIASREKRRPEEVVEHAVRAYEGTSSEGDDSTTFLRAIVGIGHSGQHNTAERAEEILRTEVGPRGGWSLHEHDSPA